jgi:hypothetical protein
MDLDEILYGHYIIAVSKIILFQFPTAGNTNMAHERTCEMGLMLVTLTEGSYDDIHQYIF